MEAVVERLTFRLRLVQTAPVLLPVFSGTDIRDGEVCTVVESLWRQFKVSGPRRQIVTNSLNEKEAEKLLETPPSSRLLYVSRLNRQTTVTYAFEPLESELRDTVSFTDLMQLLTWQGSRPYPLTLTGVNYARIRFRNGSYVEQLRYDSNSKLWGVLRIDGRVLRQVPVRIEDRIIHAPEKRRR